MAQQWVGGVAGERAGGRGPAGHGNPMAALRTTLRDDEVPLVVDVVKVRGLRSGEPAARPEPGRFTEDGTGHRVDRHLLDRSHAVLVPGPEGAPARTLVVPGQVWIDSG